MEASRSLTVIPTWLWAFIMLFPFSIGETPRSLRPRDIDDDLSSGSALHERHNALLHQVFERDDSVEDVIGDGRTSQNFEGFRNIVATHVRKCAVQIDFLKREAEIGRASCR